MSRNTHELPHLEDEKTIISGDGLPANPVSTTLAEPTQALVTANASVNVETIDDQNEGPLSRLQAITVISVVSSMVFINSIFNGMITVTLPTIAKDLALQNNLLLW